MESGGNGDKADWLRGFCPVGVQVSTGDGLARGAKVDVGRNG